MICQPQTIKASIDKKHPIIHYLADEAFVMINTRLFLQSFPSQVSLLTYAALTIKIYYFC